MGDAWHLQGVAMLLRRRRLVSAVVIGWVVFAGCQPVAPTSPAPVPSFRCTPEAGGDEFDCTQAQHDQMLALDKLYTEAEEVYRRYFEENSRIYRAGGLTEPTPVLLETTTGDFLDEAMAAYRAMKKDGQKVVGGEIKLVNVKRVPGQSTKGSLVSLDVCVDMSSTTVVSQSGSSAGFVGIEQTFFGRFDGVLKIHNSAWEELDSC